LARKPQMRVNDRIRVPEVRLIGHDGEQLGVFQTRDARKKAEDLGLDLVEISPAAKPPVCKIMDFGKYKYDQAKKRHQARKTHTVSLLKEIKMRPATGDHDLEVKYKRMREFLAQGHKVKVTIQFRGREMAHKDLGRALLTRVVAVMEEHETPEQNPKFEGRFLTTVLAPMKAKKDKERAEAKAKAKAEAKAKAKEARAAKEKDKPTTATKVSAEAGG
jgi:translation initiation factor IF-3